MLYMLVTVAYMLGCILTCSYLLQKCMLMLTAGNYYNLTNCHFYIFLCDFILSIIYTCFRSIIMPSVQGCNPCIFICPVVSASSLWSGLLAINFLSKSVFVISWCHLCLVLQINPCTIWRCLVDMFWCPCYAIACHAIWCLIYVMWNIFSLPLTCLYVVPVVLLTSWCLVVSLLLVDTYLF